MNGCRCSTGRELRRAVTLAVAMLLWGLCGCIQEAALEPIGTVSARVVTDPSELIKVGIRVNMVGTSSHLEPATSDYAFCDVEGDFTMKTQRMGRGFVVARGVNYDIGFDNIYLENFGSSDSVDRLIPATDSPMLFEKVEGDALFLVFEQDFGSFDQVHLVGDFNDWELADSRALHDDGSIFDIDVVEPGMQTSGDYAAGDGVWTLRTKLDSEDQEYGFIFDQDEDDVYRDPYEEKSHKGKSVIEVK